MRLGEPLDGAGKHLSGPEGTRPDQVRDLVGSLPCEVFSRLSPETRRSQVRCRRTSPVADGWRLSTAVGYSRAAGCVLRGAPVSAGAPVQNAPCGASAVGCGHDGIHNAN